MRFISKYGRFSMVIQPDIQEAYATGMAKVVQPLIQAQFEPWQLTPPERELAIAHWQWNGFNMSEDQVTTIPPDGRIGLYDSILDQQSKGFSDEIRILIESRLIENAKFSDDYMVVPTTLLPPPWPRYDEFRGTTDELVERLIDDGFSLAEVLAYERSNQNRDEIADALQSLLDDPDALLELQPEEILG